MEYLSIAAGGILGMYIASAARRQNTHQVVVGILAFALNVIGMTLR